MSPLGPRHRDLEATRVVPAYFNPHASSAVAALPVATHIRPLDDALGVDQIPAVAREATLALTLTRSLETEVGLDAARLLQGSCWGKDVKCVALAPDETGKLAVQLFVGKDDEESFNVQLVKEGLARAAKPGARYHLVDRMTGDSTAVHDLAKELKAAEEMARKGRYGMWRYGDVGDDDEEQKF